MKVKLLVLAMAISPTMAVVGQQKVALYNQGLMSVVADSPDQPVLYIDGDFISADDPAQLVPSMVELRNSRTVLTGNFIHNSVLSNSNVFRFFYGDKSVFEFRGLANQSIITQGASYDKIPDKKTSYIHFPTLEINNQRAADATGTPEVKVDPALAVSVVNLKLTRGTLALDATMLNSTNMNRYYAPTKIPSYYSGATKVASTQRSVLAHLKVTGNVEYSADLAAQDKGFVEVKVPFTPSSEYNTTGGAVVGMGIPFAKMGIDYFTFNYVFAPTHESYFGDGNVTLFDRANVLTAGRGYIIGNGLRGSDFSVYQESNIHKLSQAAFDARSTKEYVFNRSKLNSNILFQKEVDSYNMEKIVDTDVTIELKQGYNYLANPFTTPIDIGPLITGINVSAWGVTPGPSANQSATIYDGVWMLNETSRASAYHRIFGTYYDPILPAKTLQADMRFEYAGKTGSTYISDDADANQVILGPLQMFVVYAYKDKTTLTIPRSAQVSNKQAFVRSTNTNKAFDDVAFEVVDLKTQTTDKVGFVLRPTSDIITGKYRDVQRFISSAELNGKKEVIKNGLASALFAKSADGKELTVKHLSYTPNVENRVTTTLNLRPSAVEQEVLIRGLKLETLENFDFVRIVDNLLKKSQVLTEDQPYKTTIKPTDSEDRFTLVFERGTVGVEDEIQQQSKSISSYYSNGTLTVAGFDESDFDSNLGVYDIQGRLLTQAKVNDFTVKVSHNFAPGAYIVKVVGNNSYVAKFIVR